MVIPILISLHLHIESVPGTCRDWTLSSLVTLEIAVMPPETTDGIMAAFRFQCLSFVLFITDKGIPQFPQNKFEQATNNNANIKL